MGSGKECIAWLTDEATPYPERVEFGLNVWQSVDYTYPNKYEVFIEWLAKSLPGNELPVVQLMRLFQLRAQPGMVSQDCKASLIQALLNTIDPAKCQDNTALKLLQNMFNFDLLQDVLRADFPLICRCYGVLFDCQQRCLKLRTEAQAEEDLQTDAEIVVAMIKQLAEIARRSQKVRKLRTCYDELTVRPLVELILNLKSSCIEEMAGLEKQLQGEFILPRISGQPLHVVLLLLECSVLNNRYNTDTLSQLLRMVFEEKAAAGPQHSLTLAAHLLETLRKYDVSLQFPMAEEQLNDDEPDTNPNPEASSDEESDSMDVPETKAKKKAKPKAKKGTGTDENVKQASAFVYVSEQLQQLVKTHKQHHLRPVLMVLCSALRLNPLLLESSSYQITIWMMTAPKRTAEEEHLYSAYLVLLLDMFRRLSRSERFIMNLLKSLKDWLAKYPLPVTGAPGKRKREQEPAKSEDLDAAEKRFISLIFAECVPVPSASETERQNDEFKHLAHFWPSHSAGAAFSALVGLLKAKPSMVIWKTLLHALMELLQDAPPTEILPANQEFARELIVALLCQYLQGTRLTEHLHLYLDEVDEQMNRTAELLERFGRLLLSQEHNRRSMDAFLECLKWASSYEVLLFHYWTDAKPRTHTHRRRCFLPPDQWRLIQQRVFNFGKTACGQRLQRLEQQLVDSGWLAEEALADVVSKQQLHMLTRQQKQLRIQQKLSDMDRDTLMEDAECVELLCLQQLNDYAATVRTANVKGSLLAKLKLEELPEEAHLVATIHKKAAPGKELQLPPAQELIEFLQRQHHNELPGKIKFRLWLTLLALHHDLSRSDQQEQAKDVLELLIDLMHFGQPLAICSHFEKLRELLSLVPTTSATSWKFYETLFSRCIRLHAAGSEAFLASCSQYIKEELNGTMKLPAEALRFLLLAIETTAAATGPHAKHMQRQVQPLLDIFGQIVAHKFRPTKKKETSDYKLFVDETIKSYGTYLSGCINRSDKLKRAPASAPPPASEDAQSAETAEAAQELETINEDFRRICKIYIGHSLNYKNPHALRLLNVAISHRQKLHFDPDEVEFVLSSYWKQLYSDIAAGDIAALDVNCLELAFPLIIGYKTKEDLLVLLRTLTSEVQGLPSPLSPAHRIELQNVLTILSFVAKCSVSTIKGAMINKHFEIVSTNVAGRLKDNAHNSKCLALVLLEAQRHLANNRTVPLTNESLEYLFGTMSVVAIDQFIDRGGNWADFSQLYAALTDNCVGLLRQHSNLVSDRAGQLSAVCETLIKAIVGYRSGRQRAQDLTETELDGLAELGLKLATVMANIGATQSLPLKRVAPFLLTFTINQMVETERPTTIFEKVKVNMERVCHELIGISDHRSGQFVLRHNTTAGSNMYSRLLKDHDKYHKFRGKV
ncbi:LOW QUALITY PROTEIN: uncharacterized protein LOC111077508 [Drosophila obscura]|uniref:LOW QUALITY PROTEIN: uncharacterized protein LOC111077508 n=1 Tax=Drosophila obscura TaxID=7282 RepID=UPI001BB2ACEA|nr:LOW QUALITY PROTEIN: uncharacterized protein LOC111077508 [Drosophila obscura]